MAAVIRWAPPALNAASSAGASPSGFSTRHPLAPYALGVFHEVWVAEGQAPVKKLVHRPFPTDHAVGLVLQELGIAKAPDFSFSLVVGKLRGAAKHASRAVGRGIESKLGSSRTCADSGAVPAFSRSCLPAAGELHTDPDQLPR